MPAPLDALARQILARGSWRATATGLPQTPLPPAVAERLPREYFEVLEALGAGEGRVGRRYLRLYPLAELAAANDAYAAATYVPGLVLIGSTTEGEACAYDLAAPARPLVRVPFIPLDPVLVRREADSLVELLSAYLEEREEPASTLPAPPDEDRPGHELHEITPACLGGVLSVDNLVLLPIADHAELCRFWNKVYRRLRAERRRGSP